jgi:hypothetical protein
MANPRRNPKAPGLAGLTDADRVAWLGGTVTIEELAGRLGVSKQAVSTEFRKRGWREGKTKGAGSPSVGDKAEEALTIPDELTLPQAVERVYVRTVLGVLDLLGREAMRLQEDPAAVVGPSSLKAMAVAVSTLREELSACGLLDLRQAEPAPTTLIIRTLTAAEEEAIQANAEAAYAAQHAAGADAGDDLTDEPPTVAGEKGQGHRTGPLRPENESPTHAGWLRGPLPTPERFREWLAFVGQQQGNITLRRILTDLGREAPGRAVTRDMLIERIVEVAKGDPRRLDNMCCDKTDSAGQ